MPRKSDYDDTSSSSSSSSDSEDEIINQPVDEKPLSLLDDDSTAFLVLPPRPEDDESALGELDRYSEITTDIAESHKDSANETPVNIDAEQDAAKPKKKKKKRKVLYICTAACKYEVIRRVSKRFGFREVAEEDDWNLYWTDYSVALERVMEMKRYQKINHYPGMSEICRKDLLARNLTRMSKQFPKEYNMFPKSWVFPADYGDFASYARQKKNKTYIMKPASGCQGKGIWITKNIKDIKPHEHQVCQQYLSRPFLIDGFKFDFRLYVLVTSCDPFRIFCFKDGLARFATTKYHDPTNGNTENVFMHLTNYAINKTSDDFVRDDEEGGSKRRISTINRWWEENGYDLGKIWGDIDDVIIKTLISITEVLTHNYRTCFPNHIRGSACFEILGFDVMFDRKLKPYVVEVNHSPSFHTDARLDKEIKEALIYDTVNLINCGAVDKKKCIEEERKRIKERLFTRGPNKKESKEELEIQQAAYLKTLTKFEDGNLGNFRRIYPADGTEKYEKFFHSSGSLFQETAAYKARSEAARLQREEIRQKKEKMDNILNRKKRDTAVCPESPGGTRRRVIRRPTLTNRRLMSQPRSSDQASSTGATPCSLVAPIDTMQPLEISEEEELERISALLQRDNLVRGLGIVEHVYRMLQSTPGAMGGNRPPSNESTLKPDLPSHPQTMEPDSIATASILNLLKQPLPKSLLKHHNTFVTSQRNPKLFAHDQNAANPWQRNRVNNKKYGPDIEADRRSLMRNTGSESAQLLNRHNSISEAGSRRPYGITHTAPVFDTIGMNGQGLQAVAAIPGKVQPASGHHLSVVSAPAPVMHRPEPSVNRKLNSLETSIKTRQPNRRTVKLKSLDPNPNALVYS